MAIDFNAHHVGADVRTHTGEAQDGDHAARTSTGADETGRQAPVRNASVDAEYTLAEAGQRNRVQASAGGDPAATAAPVTTESETAATGPDFSRLGAAFVEWQQAPPQMLWVSNEHNTAENSVNTVLTYGRQQGGISDQQIALNNRLAKAVMQAAGEGASTPMQFGPADLATLLQASGLPLEWQDPNQLVAATRYINTQYPDGASQQARIAKTLHDFHILHNIGHPQVDRQQMLDLLWGAATVPGHAFRKAGDSDLAASYQQIAAALNGPAGKHEIALKKHNLEFTTNEAGQVTHTDTDRTHAAGMKIVSGILTVASFIPPLSIPASIANAALSAYQGVKNGDWLQAIGGIATGVAAGAGAIAGKAITGAAATTARVADGIAKTAYGVQAGLQAAQGGDMMGIINAGLQTASGVAGAVGKGAEGVARTAGQVQKWADRVMIGERVVVDFKNGDYAAALANGSALTGAIGAEIGGPDGARGVKAAEYLGYTAAAAQVAQSLEAGDYDTALAASRSLVGDIGDGPADDGSQPAWAQRTSEWLDYASIGRGIEQAIRHGDYDTALQASQALIHDVGNGTNDDRAAPQWAVRGSEYLDYTRAGLAIEQSLRDDVYATALRTGQGLVDDVANGVRDDRSPPPWVVRLGHWMQSGAAVADVARPGSWPDPIVLSTTPGIADPMTTLPAALHRVFGWDSRGVHTNPIRTPDWNPHQNFHGRV